MDKINNKKRRILLVEDNNLNLRIMSRVLQNMGIDVIESSSGEEAIRHVKSEELYMIFMCVFVPEIVGCESTRKMRELNGPNKDVPIIAVSSIGSDKLRNKVMECGVNEIISKPLKEEELKSIFSKYIVKKNSDEFKIFNKKIFEDFYDSNSLKKEIITIFLHEKDSDLDRINKAFNYKNKDVIYDALHYMKGSFAYLKADNILDLTQQILDLLGVNKLSDALLLEKTFIKKYNLLLEDLSIYIKNFN